MNKTLKKQLDYLELALMSPLERETSVLLLELYGTTNPDPAVLSDLLASCSTTFTGETRET
jgi:hypothetical protein